MKNFNRKRLYKTIQHFLFSNTSRELLVFSFFLFVASTFWLLRTLDNEYEYQINVPLKLVNVPRGTIITENIPATASVTVKDVGTSLLSYILESDNKPARISFTDYSSRGSHVVLRNSELQKSIASALQPSMKILSVHTDSIEFFYTKGMWKRIPVLASPDLSAASQYYTSSIKVTPKHILAYAPKSILDTLHAAYISSTPELQKISESKTLRLPLRPIKGVKLKPNVADVAVSIDQFVEKTVEVEVKSINFPPDKMLRTFPSRVKIVFQVGMKNYRNVNASDFILSISYEELLRLKGDKCPLSLKSLPKGARHVRIEPQSVDYIIETRHNK